MAHNVFGNPITNSTLEGMPEYSGKKIERVDRARVALNMKNAGERDYNARTYVEKLKEQWGAGVSTLGLIYNATGDPLTYADEHNWYGHIGTAPYPIRIENGQWAAFLHVKASGAASGSNAAVVYRGKRGIGDVDCDWMVAWSNPWGVTNRNRVCTMTREVDYFQKNWYKVDVLLNTSNFVPSKRWEGCLPIVMTGIGTSPILEAQLTLSDALKAEAM